MVFLAWKIPRTEEPGELQSMGSQTVGPNLANQRRQQHLLKSSITGHLNFCSLDTAKNLIAILIYQEKKKEAEGREATDRGRKQEGHPGGRSHMHKGLGWG